jgi:hypothetical protein
MLAYWGLKNCYDVIVIHSHLKDVHPPIGVTGSELQSLHHHWVKEWLCTLVHLVLESA